MWKLENRDAGESLRKLWSGFCQTKKDQLEDDDDDHDSGTGGAQVASEPDLTLLQEREIPKKNGTLHPVSTKAADDDDGDDEDDGRPGEEIEVSLATNVRDPELLKATYFGRRDRVIRGLGVSFVALLAVFITLFTLQRIEMADFTFSVVGGGESSLSAEIPPKPLIQIQYNERKTKTPNVEVIDDQNVPLETETLTVDRVQQKLDELRALVADIKSSSEL